MSYKEQALLELAPGKEWSILGTTLVWHSEGPHPSEQEIEARAAELAAAAPLEDLRHERNQKLADCDWVVVKATEMGEEVPADWKLYRQALRDITNSYQSLDNVVWPQKPE